jgi:hypothetical protein
MNRHLAEKEAARVSGRRLAHHAAPLALAVEFVFALF